MVAVNAQEVADLKALEVKGIPVTFHFVPSETESISGYLHQVKRKKVKENGNTSSNINHRPILLDGA